MELLPRQEGRMTFVRAVVLSTLLCVWATPLALAKEKKPTGGARPTAAGKPAEENRLEWVERSDPKGFTLKVPQGATDKRDEWSTTYEIVLASDSSRLKAIVSVEALDEFTPITDLDKAVAFATTRRPGAMKATVAEQRGLPDGYLVVIGPEYDLYTVHVIRNGKEVQVKAQCSGPSARLRELKELCLSVKPTK
jgi:hypothetical protein